MNTSAFNKVELIIIGGIILLIYALGALIDMMEVDAAQYASMSRQMLETNEFLQIKNRDAEYLDKPPFLFWISALSIKLFGVFSWSYKLPSILFSLLGIYSTYSLAKLLYDKKTGILAALMLASCQAVFVMNNDVRTDNILTATVIFSIWQLYAFLQNKQIVNLVLGFTGIGIAMLTKGPIGLVVPIFALSAQFIYKKQWALFFKWEWLIGVLIVALILLPMCIGLYQQHGTDGLYFYFWKQSFGRITGESEWKNDTDIFYFTHVLLWTFLPWCILIICSIYNRTIELFKNKSAEALSWGGFVLGFFVFSLSKYKLPHYIFVTFPLAAILGASWIIQQYEENKFKLINVLSIFQLILTVLLFAGAAFILYAFPPDTLWLWYILAALFLWYSIKSFLSADHLRKLIFTALYAILFANILLNGNFYLQILKFQAPTAAGKLFHENHKPGEKLYFYLPYAGHSLDYYGRTITMWLPDQGINNAWIYTDEEGLKKITSREISIKKTFELKNYSVQNLSFPFLNPKKRETVLKKIFLIQI